MDQGVKEHLRRKKKKKYVQKPEVQKGLVGPGSNAAEHRVEGEMGGWSGQAQFLKDLPALPRSWRFILEALVSHD